MLDRLAADALALAIIATPAAVFASPQATWELQWHNDDFFSSDNQFTSGLSVRKHSALYDSLAATRGTPAFGKLLAGWLLPREQGLHYRESWGLGQNMQTPNRIGREELITNDVPYVGMIGWSNAFAAFDDQRFIGTGLVFGWVGASTYAEEVQQAAHDLTGATEPRGWDNQLDDEVLVNVYLSHKRKIYNGAVFDVAASVGVAAGNYFSYGRAGVELRLGNAPAGFTYTPTPIGHGLDLNARLRAPGAVNTYASLTLRGTGFAHALPREGNTFVDGNEWTERNTIDPEPWVGEAVLGIHHERPRWGVHLDLWFTSDTVAEGGLVPSEDPRNNFGTLTLEWRP